MSAKRKKKKPSRSGGVKLQGKAKARQRAKSQRGGGGEALTWPTPAAGVDAGGAEAVESAAVGTEVAVGGSGGAGATAKSADGGGNTAKFSRKREARQAELSARQTRDGLRWIGVGLLVLSGIVANFYFGEASLLYRLLGMIAVGVLAAPLALGTTSGVAFSQLLRESRVELRKVVWPSRAEVTQTTLLVLAFVLLVGLILWGLDAGLGWIVARSIGG